MIEGSMPTKRWALGLGLIALMLTAAATPVRAAREDGRARPYVEDAERYLEAGNIRAAIVQLKNALREDQSDIDARFLLGTIYLGIEDGVSAEKELRAAYNQGLDSDLLRERLGEALLLQGKFQELLDEIHAEGLDPVQRATVMTLRGRAHMGLEDADEASKIFKEAQTVDPQSIAPKLYLSRVYLQKRDLEAAAEQIDSALSLKPDSDLGLIMKGELLRLGGDSVAAIEQFDAALQVKPTSLEASLGRAASLIDLDRDKEAQRDLDRVFEISSRQPLAYHLSAVVLARSNELVAAEEMLDRAGAPLENYLPSMYLRGTISYSRNNLEQAYSYLRRFLEAEPGNLNARRMLGSTLVRQGTFVEAIEVLQPIADSEEAGDAQSLALVATAYLGAGQQDLATTYLERAVAKAPDHSQLRTQLALIKLSQGEGAEAIEGLKAAVELDPTAPQPPVLLARLHLASGEYDETISIVEGLLEQRPNDPALHNLLGAAYFLKSNKQNAGADEEEEIAKHKERAKAALTKALDLDPTFFPAVQNLAQMDLRDGNPEAAERRFLNVLSKDSRHEGAMMAAARLAMRKGNADDAIDWLERAVLMKPESREPALRLMSLYIDMGDPEKALATVSQLDLLLGDDATVIEALAKTQLAAGDPSSAVATYSRLSRMLPGNAQVHYALGRAQVRAQDVFGARSSYRQALELDPSMLAAVLDLINVEIDSERFHSAIQIAQALQEAQPEQPMGDLLVGHVRGKMGEQNAALAAFANAEKKLDSSDSAARLYYGYSDIGHRQKGFDVLENWLTKKPDDHPLRRILATAYLEEGLYQVALKHYLVLEEVDGSNPIILNNLAWLFQLTDDDRALDAAQRAYQLLPDAAAVKDTYGWIMVERGDLSRGVALLEEASALAPDQPEIQYHLALGRAKQGRQDEACSLLRSVLGTSDADFSFRGAAEELSRTNACN